MTNHTPTTGLKILRQKEVTEKTGLSKTSIYDLISRGEFPAPVKLSKRSSGWFEHETDEWLLSRQRTGGGHDAA